MPRRRGIVGIVTSALPLVAACFTGAGAPLLPAEADPGAASGDSGVLGDVAAVEPLAIHGLTPSHGPFTGGTRARLDGRGWASSVHVFVGGTEVAARGLLASDPTHAAILTPPGAPGFADVRLHDDVTASDRVLAKGFFYDPFVVAPDRGATGGGTRITIAGSGTAWAAGTTVAIAGVACADVVVSSLTSLGCVTPAGTPGVKDIVVDGVQVRDAFAYADSDDGYRGGLSGAAFAGHLRVLAFDAVLATPILGALVFVGTGPGTPTTNGVAEIDNVVGANATVTVAAPCFSPRTYVDVPVDTVTVYLAPDRGLACATGDPRPYPRPAVALGSVEGELLFSGSGWSTVPAPRRSTERQAAYTFSPSADPGASFVLPPASEAITTVDLGTNGYRYTAPVRPGNVTLYVLAGLEDRSLAPPSFSPYVMGVVRGVAVPTEERVRNVDVAMDVPIDHQVTIVATPPAPGARSPDRFVASVATTLGAAGYAIFPFGTRTVGLPPPALPFVVPALDRALAGEAYVLGGAAVTGPSATPPASVVRSALTTGSDAPVALEGFPGIPVLGAPGSGVWSGSHVSFSSTTFDLARIDVTAGARTWMILAPGGTTAFDLPALASPFGLSHGTISTTVYTARIDEFSYATVRDGQLETGAWTAYAVDTLGGVH